MVFKRFQDGAGFGVRFVGFGPVRGLYGKNHPGPRIQPHGHPAPLDSSSPTGMTYIGADVLSPWNAGSQHGMTYI